MREFVLCWVAGSLSGGRMRVVSSSSWSSSARSGPPPLLTTLSLFAAKEEREKYSGTPAFSKDTPDMKTTLHYIIRTPFLYPRTPYFLFPF